MWSFSVSSARTSARVEAILSTHGFNILFLVTYGVSVSLMFLWGFHTEFEKHFHETLTFRWCIAMARGAGYTLNMNCALVILLASRLFLTALRDTPFGNVLPLDKAFPALHILVAYTAIAGVIVHVPFHFGWIALSNQWVGGLWSCNMTVATGCALLIVLTVLFVFALPYIRKKNFRLFHLVHIIGAFLFFVLLLFHGMYNEHPETYKYIVPPLVIYILDRVIRRLRMTNHNIKLSAENSLFMDNNILQLKIPKCFNFKPGQYAEIMVPSINREWHPYTIASAQYERDISFFIKSLGDWTGKLHEEIRARLSGKISLPLHVTVRGPFGAPTQEVSKYQRVFLISGGIGATPFASICKQLHHLHEKKDAPLSLSHRARKHERTMLDALLAEGAEQRIRNAISSIFDVDITAIGDISRVSQNAQLQRFTNMLRVSSRRTFCNDQDEYFGAITYSDTSVEDTESDNDFLSIDSSSENSGQSCVLEFSTQDSKTVGKKMRKVNPPAHVYRREEPSFTHQLPLTPSEKRARVKLLNLTNTLTSILLFLHTSRVAFLLAVLIIVRAAVVVAGSIFRSEYVFLASIQSGHNIILGRWVPLAYGIISVPICIILMATVSTELILWKGRMFHSIKSLVELFVFGPLVITMTGIEFWRWAAEVHGGSTVVLLQYLFAQGAVFLLVIGRLWSSVGKQGLPCEDECSAQARTSGHLPDADFVWTTPTSIEDEWLRRDIHEVTRGRAVRLHRFVTREKDCETYSGCGGEIERERSDPLTKCTNIGRPDWDRLLSMAARETRSDGVIGIFFCGPHKMGQAVQQSAQRVEMWSNLRDAYLRSTDVYTLMTDLGLTDATVLGRLRKYGCRVRFVFREENFS